jgi:hypothetical protein
MKMCSATAEGKHKICCQMLKVHMAAVKNGLLTFRIIMRHVRVKNWKWFQEESEKKRANITNWRLLHLAFEVGYARKFSSLCS